MVDCQLCDLPTPDPPVRGATSTAGSAVAAAWRWLVALEDVDDPEVDEIGDADRRRRTDGRDGAARRD